MPGAIAVASPALYEYPSHESVLRLLFCADGSARAGTTARVRHVTTHANGHVEISHSNVPSHTEARQRTFGTTGGNQVANQLVWARLKATPKQR